MIRIALCLVGFWLPLPIEVEMSTNPEAPRANEPITETGMAQCRGKKRRVKSHFPSGIRTLLFLALPFTRSGVPRSPGRVPILLCRGLGVALGNGINCKVLPRKMRIVHAGFFVGLKRGVLLL